MSLVLDCSVTLAWLLPDEVDAERAAPILERVSEHGAFVPPLWSTEVGNALLVAQRRDRIGEEDLEAALAMLSRRPIVLDPSCGPRAWMTALSLARWHGLTLYDAVYLDLAKHRALPLATFDRQLRHCARDEGVPLLPA